MAEERTDGSVTLESPDEEPQHLDSEETFDWVDYRCSCPHCGKELNDFRTRDLCNMRDTIEYRIAYHFYAVCKCGAWIDFIRKPASNIDDFDMQVEQL